MRQNAGEAVGERVKERDGKTARERKRCGRPQTKSVNECVSERESDRKSERTRRKVDNSQTRVKRRMSRSLTALRWYLFLRIPEERTFTADAVKGSGREGKSGCGRQMTLNTNQHKAAALRR